MKYKLLMNIKTQHNLHKHAIMEASPDSYQTLCDMRDSLVSRYYSTIERHIPVFEFEYTKNDVDGNRIITTCYTADFLSNSRMELIIIEQ